MDATLDLSRWRSAPKGVGYRRWVMISAGVRRIMKLRLFRWLIAIAWIAGALVALFGFAFSQTVASGGWLEVYAAKIGPRPEALAKALTGLVALYPDVCINGLFTLVFWLHSHVALIVSLIALTALVPQLITRDQATNALTVYLSRPLTTTDYLLGKLGTITIALLLLWTGPLLFGWVLSMVFATDSDFMAYSVGPLLHALMFNGIALVVLALLALGVSALGRSSLVTILTWLGFWLVAWFLASVPESPAWLQRASFMHDLGQVRQSVLQLDAALTTAGSKLPLIDQEFADAMRRGGAKAHAEDFQGALLGLAVLAGAASAVFFRKLKPE